MEQNVPNSNLIQQETSHLNNFYYLVYQAYPRRDIVYYWVDGTTTRRFLKRPLFYSTMNKVPKLTSLLADSLDTTSFFLYDNVEGQIIQLNPKQQVNNFEYPLSYVFKVGYGHKAVEYGDKTKRTLDDQLNELGFDAPNADQIANLRVALVKIKPDVVL